MIRFLLNDKEVSTALPPGTLLLDYIRYHRHLPGTKIGCREGDCGACTVLVGEVKNGEIIYSAVTSCLMALANAQGKHIVTIEGLNPAQGLNPIQQAMSDEAATQCGFCTPGFVVSLAGFCLSPTDRGPEAAIAAINGNICRCTGYKSIERAAAKVAALTAERGDESPIHFATNKGILPPYFKDIPERLTALAVNNEPLKTNGQQQAATLRFLGGGTDLYVQQPEVMVHTDLNPLFSNEVLKGIYQEGNTCYVGGAATVTDILTSPIFKKHFPPVHKFIKLVSSTPIRNMATVGGNLVNASPIGDLTIFFLALEAQIVLTPFAAAASAEVAGPAAVAGQASPALWERRGVVGRVVPLNAFYKGYKQMDKAPDELIAKIFFELPDESTCFNFEKVCKRTHLDIASVNTAMKVRTANGFISEAVVSAGGVGPVPVLLQKASSFLAGKEMSEGLILEAIEIAQTEISPISDVRGSEEYKRLLLSQLIKAHFLTLFPQMSVDQLLR